jgi:release factor glutamine methyltransferase
VRLVPFPGVFRPPSDTRLLAEHLTREPQLAGASVLDLCTGSGVLAIVAARCGARRVVAVDISRCAVLAARMNAKLNGVSVEAVRGDLFSPLKGERFDVIVSNPPYIPSESDQLPRRGRARSLDAGMQGRAFIDRICAGARDHLRPGGALLIVHSSFCIERATLDALDGRGLTARIAERQHGPIGPVVKDRAEMLRRRGLLSDHDLEDMLIIRAQRA